jgi:hypothetical protein
LLLFVSIGFVSILAPSAAGTSLLPADAVTEVMMETQGADAVTIARLFGSDANSVLSYMSFVNVAAQSFSYAMNPGATYLGMPISLTGSWFLNTNDVWTLSSNGQVGSTTWTQTGTGTISGDPKGSFTFFTGPLDLEFTIDYATFPDATESVFSIALTLLGVPVLSGNGYDRLDSTGIEIGNWNWNLNPIGNQFRVDTRGHTPFPDGGAGIFTQQILPVPEPATWFLLAPLFAAILGLRLWRNGFRCGLDEV